MNKHENWPTDEEIDTLCSPGRSERWRGDGRQYDRDTVRLVLQSQPPMMKVADVHEVTRGLEALLFPENPNKPRYLADVMKAAEERLRALAARPTQPNERSAIGKPRWPAPDLLERVKSSIRNDLGLIATEHQALMVIDALSRDGASLEARDAEASLACARSTDKAAFMDGARWMAAIKSHWPVAAPAPTLPAEESLVCLSEGLTKDLLNHCPYALRSNPDGGPENLAESLDMTFRRMEQILEGREYGTPGGVDVTLPLRQRLFGRTDRRKLAEVVAEAVRQLDASGRGTSTADVIRDAAEVLSAIPSFLVALESAENKEPLQPGNLRKLVRAARAYRAPVEAWMYLHDGMVYGPDNLPTVVPACKRWPKESVTEPWTEVPLIAGG
jgi:hypothetical protein